MAVDGARPWSSRGADRRDPVVRARCDAVAGWFALHPSVLAPLDPATVSHMASRLPRGRTLGGRRVVIGGFVMDRRARTVAVDGRGIPLTRREFDLLSFLLAAAGRVLGHHSLLDPVAGPLAGSSDRVLYVYIRRLRVKVEGAGAPFRISTVRCSGYRLDTLI